MERMRWEIESLGGVTVEVLRNMRSERMVEELRWKGMDLKWKANDIAIEILLRFQPLARELRFMRACIEVLHNLYRIARYVKGVSKLCPNCEVTKKAVKLLIPWIREDVEGLTGDRKINRNELPYLQEAFEEFNEEELPSQGLQNSDDARMLEGTFNHLKHILASPLYYQRGMKTLEGTPILYIT
ncbi:hypothetical protein [Pyrococcus kukulkanii]|uniref:hypothetical protein n=1 Tax=Pyrococcus kukulkanii TaxID=1609559 RepID=UPI0035693F46